MRVQTGQPLSQLWSEYLTARPTGNPITNALILGMVVWTSGLVAYALRSMGAAVAYIDSVLLYGWLFYIPLMVFGFQYFHRNYVKEVRGFRPHLKISDEEFGSLIRRLDFLVCNRWVVFIFAILMTGYFELTNVTTVVSSAGTRIFLPTPLQQLVSQLSAGQFPTSDALWGTGLSYLNWLLLATGIWLVISLWIGIFLISRRPLNFTPARFSHEFRGLARLNLKTTGFYFLGLAVPSTLNFYFSVSTSRSFDPLSLAFFYALMIPGVIGFLAPHYNIHKTLLNSKENELERIDKEIAHFSARLHDLHLTNSEDLQEYVKLSARLIALLASERRIAEADDWPLDHSQISVFLALVIVPILVNLATSPPPGFP